MSYLTEDPLLLPRLLIGLEALQEKYEKREYHPYPPTLSVAWNALSLRLLAAGKASAPVSLTELLALCARPVGDWFPASLPDEFPPEIRLLHSGGGIDLTDTARGFLSDAVARNEKIRELADAAGTERALQNGQFVALLQRLRNAKDADRAQKDYVLLRRFLIAKPFATTEEIRATFAQASVKPSEVGAFYRDCAPDEPYYCCPACGPLRRQSGRWRGAKPDVCSDHLGDDLTAHALPYRDGLRYLCTAIHERVCLHGIEEVRWLDAVRGLQNKPKAQNPVVAVEDWPGVDVYDLRLTFRDGTVWAADMKDYRTPEALAKTLEAIPALTDALRYDLAFYVVPDRREARTRGYCRRAGKEAQLPANHQIVTASAFADKVEAQMSRRKTRETAP